MNTQAYTPFLNIVLVNPKIPQNTGNIGRTCAATFSKLHIVGQTGFSMEDKYLKRAGLDYWPKLNFEKYETWENFINKNTPKRLFLFSTHSNKKYDEIKYDKGDFLVFGSETLGLSDEIKNYPNTVNVTIPQNNNVRCFNLSNSVAIGLFEALRQNKFDNLN